MWAWARRWRTRGARLWCDDPAAPKDGRLVDRTRCRIGRHGEHLSVLEYCRRSGAPERSSGRAPSASIVRSVFVTRRVALCWRRPHDHRRNRRDFGAGYLDRDRHRPERIPDRKAFRVVASALPTHTDFRRQATKKSAAVCGASRVAGALRMAAVTIQRSKSALGAAYRRIARHKSAAVAVFAVARKSLSIACWHILV